MKKFLEEFKAFAMRGNVIDMAVGVLRQTSSTRLSRLLQAALKRTRTATL